VHPPSAKNKVRPDRRQTALTSMKPAAPSPSRSWLRENLRQSLPMFGAGGAFLGLGLWSLNSWAGAAGRLPLWLLLAALGATLTASAVALTFVEEAPPYVQTRLDSRYIFVERDRWEKLLTAAQRPVSAPKIATRPSTAPAPTVSPNVSAGARSPPTVAAPSPSEGKSLPGNVPQPSPASPSPLRRAPAWEEGDGSSPTAPAYDESVLDSALDSILTVLEPIGQLGPGGPQPPGSSVAGPRCTSCGAVLQSSGTSNSCVVCDRPLCPNCQARSFEAGHPGMCLSCDTRRRHSPTSTP
jgi:hypothetical protein